MAAVSTGVLVSPQLEVNLNRKGPFDVAKGAFSSILNDFFERARLNGTLIGSELGTCYPNATCTGQFELLNRGAADFSIFGLSVDVGESYRNLSIGPYTGSTEVFYQSTPYQEGYRSSSDVLNSFNQMSLDFYILHAVMFVSVYMIINRSCKLKFKKIIKSSEMFSWFMRQSNHQYRMMHRTFAASAFVFCSLVTLTLMACIFNATMVMEHKAKYYESIDEVLKNHKTHGKKVILCRNLFIHPKLVSRYEVWSNVASRATFLSQEEWISVPDHVSKGNILFGTNTMVGFVRASICSRDREMYRVIRESAVLKSEATYVLFARTVSSEVKMRVCKLISMQLQAGIVRLDLDRYVKSNVAEMFAGNRTQLDTCEGQERVQKWPPNIAIDISFKHFYRLQMSYLIAIGAAAVVFVLELLVNRINKKKRKRRVNDENLHSR